MPDEIFLSEGFSGLHRRERERKTEVISLRKFGRTTDEDEFLLPFLCQV